MELLLQITSAVHGGHAGCGVTGTGGAAHRCGCGEFLQVPGGQFNCQGRHVLFQIRAPLGSGNGHHVLTLCQDPRQRQLRRFASLSLGHGFEVPDDGQVLLEGLPLEPRAVPPPVVVGQVVDFPDRAGEEATAKRALGHEADAQLPAGGEDFHFHVPAPQRVLRLQGGDRMDCGGAADGGLTNSHTLTNTAAKWQEVPAMTKRCQMKWPYFMRSSRA